MNKQIKSALATGLLIGFSGLAPASYAATIEVSGSFNNPNASNYFFFNRTYNQDNDSSPAVQLPNNLVSPTDSVSYFGWGIDRSESYAQHQIIQSHFWFNGTGSVDGSTDTSITLGDSFSLGSFTYTNEETVLSGGYVEIDFQMDIAFDGINLAPIEYTIGIDNTANSLTPSDDTASIVSTPGNFSFSSGGTEYLLALNGFSRDGGLTFETSATLPEGQQTSAQIYATITSITPVPVPAAAWLFMSGLIGLVGLSRRK